MGNDILASRLVNEVQPAPGDVLTFVGGIWRPAPAPSLLDATWLDKYLARSLTRAGIPGGQVSYLFEEFTSLARWYKVAGGASMLGQPAISGGVGEIAAVAVDSVLYLNGSAALGSPSITKADSRWYTAGRMRLPVAPSPSSYSLCGLESGAPFAALYFGYSGPDSPTNFTAVSDTGFSYDVATSTVLVDTLWHDFEFWSPGGGAYWLAVDDEAPVGITVAAPATSFLIPFFQGITGPNPGDDITMQLDKALWVFPQAG